MQGLGPRFAVEVAFLVALAIGAGIAELSAAAIVIVMALAWLLICLFELAVWAEGPRFPLVHRRTATVVEEPAPEVTEVRTPEKPARWRFWRRTRTPSGEGA